MIENKKNKHRQESQKNNIVMTNSHSEKNEEHKIPSEKMRFKYADKIYE